MMQQLVEKFQAEVEKIRNTIKLWQSTGLSIHGKVTLSKHFYSQK